MEMNKESRRKKPNSDSLSGKRIYCLLNKTVKIKQQQKLYSI